MHRTTTQYIVINRLELGITNAIHPQSLLLKSGSSYATLTEAQVQQSIRIRYNPPPTCQPEEGQDYHLIIIILSSGLSDET